MLSTISGIAQHLGAMQTKAMKRRQLVQILIGFTVSGVLLVWLASRLDLATLKVELARIDYSWLLPATGLLVAHFYARALRWRYLLPASNTKVKIHDLLAAILVGNFASYILPARAGEVVRPLYLSRVSSVSFGSGFGSVVIERFFDLAVVLGSFAYLAPHVPQLPQWAKSGASLLSLVAAAIFAGMLAASFFPNLVLRLSRPIVKLAPARIADKLQNLIKELVAGAAILHRPVNLLLVILLSALVWATCYGLFAVFLGLVGEPIDMWVGSVLAVIVALAVAAPSAPGFIGPYQIGCVAGLGLFAVSVERATAYSLVTHAFQYVIFIMVGLYFILRYGFSLRDMQSEKK